MARRRGRLIAACTTGAVAAGALALGPAGVARADGAGPSGSAWKATSARAGASGPAGPSRTSDLAGASRTSALAGRHPTVVLPHHKTVLSAAAAADALVTPRYDVDGDGLEDFITQEIDGTVHQLGSVADKWTPLGQSPVMYRDILTPGNLTAGIAGPEVLSLTTTGRLSLWDHTAFPTGTPVWTGIGWQIYNKVVAVGDIDGDGWGDLLARTPSGDLFLYKGTGSATAPFAARVKVGNGYGVYDQLIGAGDITATGHETLVARDLDGDLWMYTLDGTAADPLSARVKIGTGWNVYNQLVGAGDEKGAVGGIFGRALNGDLYWYEGTGTGTGTATLTARSRISTDWNSQLVVGQGSVPMWGRNDLFGQTSGGNLYYYYGNLDGALSARLAVGDAGAWRGSRLLTSVSLSQQDEEPLLEIYNGTLYNDTPGFETVRSSGWGGYDSVFGPGDLNGDGNADLLARDTGGVLWLLTGKGNGTFYGRARVGAGWGGYNALTGAGDINGDGIPDIVARAGNGHLYLYLGTGVGSAPFRSRQDIGAGWNIYSRLAAPGDLDGDGRADLVGATPGGRLYRYSGSGRTGTATFGPRVEIGTAGWNTYSAIF
ncbi:FG-GAP repeat domain-containing protein [Actinacidiphila acidipaludis]|uniref:VCBS repeat-containing protein n=1 Tax=Actinacidiphila acidipaludis TaxID=2873382 RepID=A0ABS7QDC8_9ACTN|nr:VCBS repeat-containing protein [Streptomyces acidipaludis]MBY8880410.1 VCBS repeat-containing protein [Streptomyces acidipaludis]